MVSIEKWLGSRGLGKYTKSFVESDIDIDVLAELTNSDLKELGLSLGDRKRFLLAVENLAGDNVANQNESAPAPISTAEAEHRSLTILFSDLVGSTELSVDFDPESLRKINRDYQDIVTSSVEQFGGYVARYMGDGVLAYFGYPQAYEDDPNRAVRSALEIVSAIQSMKTNIVSGVSHRIKVRVGIETGPVVVGDVIGKGASRESPVVGETPNLAARIQGLAKPDTVAIGPGTQSRIDESIRTKSLGVQKLKGFPNPVEIWQVAGTGGHSERFDVNKPSGFGRFIGRAAELEILNDCWSCAQEKQTAMVEISGDAGIGKSRLVYEFLNAGRENATILQGHCISHGASTAFLPFRDMLQRRCGLSDDPTVEQITEKITSTVDDLAVDQRHSPYLLKLFGITVTEIVDVDMELMGLRIREAIITFILAHARTNPAVLFINDLHWIDDSSEISLQSLSRQSSQNSILFLSTSRPEYKAAWDSHTTFTRISLGPLSSAETTILIRENLKGSSVEDRLFEVLLDRAGGNPLFAEELARHTIDNRLISRSSSINDPSLPVPDTLEGLLLHRVDQLSPEAKRMLQTASVAGRRFRSDLICNVLGLTDPDSVIEELESHSLIRADKSSGKSVFRFRHALVHDVINASLLKSDKQMLHQLIGSELEHRYEGRETEICEDLARHFSETEDVDKSARYCAMAGEKALGLFAIGDARLWYYQSLEQIAAQTHWADDELLANVLVNQLEVLCFDADFEGMVTLAETHLPRVIRIGQTRQVSRMYSWLGEAYLVSARFKEAKTVLEKALAIAKEINDPVCIGYATGDLMWLQALTTGFKAQPNVRLHNEVIRISESEEIPYLKTLAFYASALDFAQYGLITKAKELTTQSIQLGKTLNYPPALSWGHSVRAFIDILECAPEQAVVEAHEAIRHASCQYDRIMGESIYSYALVLSGRVNEGMVELERIRPEIIKRGINNMLPAVDVAYGLALVQQKDLETGLSQFSRSKSRLEKQGNKRALCYLHLVLGELYLAMIPDHPEFTDSNFWNNIQLSVQNRSEMIKYADENLAIAITLGEEANMNGFAAKASSELASLRTLQNLDDEAAVLIRRAKQYSALIE